MAWADEYVARLKKGETVQITYQGKTLKGRLESGQVCTFIPAKPEHLKPNDIVLCSNKWQTGIYILTGYKSDKLEISTTRGVAALILPRAVHGKLVKID